MRCSQCCLNVCSSRNPATTYVSINFSFFLSTYRILCFVVSCHVLFIAVILFHPILISFTPKKNAHRFHKGHIKPVPFCCCADGDFLQNSPEQSFRNLKFAPSGPSLDGLKPFIIIKQSSIVFNAEMDNTHTSPNGF